MIVLCLILLFNILTMEVKPSVPLFTDYADSITVMPTFIRKSKKCTEIQTPFDIVLALSLPAQCLFDLATFHKKRSCTVHTVCIHQKEKMNKQLNTKRFKFTKKIYVCTHLFFQREKKWLVFHRQRSSDGKCLLKFWWCTSSGAGCWRLAVVIHLIKKGNNVDSWQTHLNLQTKS